MLVLVGKKGMLWYFLFECVRSVLSDGFLFNFIEVVEFFFIFLCLLVVVVIDDWKLLKEVLVFKDVKFVFDFFVDFVWFLDEYG